MSERVSSFAEITARRRPNTRASTVEDPARDMVARIYAYSGPALVEINCDTAEPLKPSLNPDDWPRRRPTFCHLGRESGSVRIPQQPSVAQIAPIKRHAVSVGTRARITPIVGILVNLRQLTTTDTDARQNTHRTAFDDGNNTFAYVLNARVNSVRAVKENLPSYSSSVPSFNFFPSIFSTDSSLNLYQVPLSLSQMWAVKYRKLKIKLNGRIFNT